MSLFFGRDSVLADLELHKFGSGLVTTGTLTRQTGGSPVALNNVCLWPDSQATALGRGGFPATNAQLTIWRTGEDIGDVAPDDVVAVKGKSYMLVSVTPRLNDEEAEGFAIYDCTVTKAIGG